MSQTDSTISDLNREYVATRVILTLFKLMGLASITVQRSPTSKLRKKCAWQNFETMQFSTSWLGCAYNLCLIPLQMCVLILAVPISYDQDYPNKTAINSAIDMAACIIGHVTLFVIWLTHGIRQKPAVRLLNQLLGFDCTARFIATSRVPTKSSRQFYSSITCAIYIVLTVGMLYIDQLTFGVLVVSYVMMGIPSVITAWFIAQYSFVVKLIENRFETLNRSLLDCHVSTDLDLTRRSFVTRELIQNTIFAPNIADIRRAHRKLSRIACEISSFYSIPILMSVAYHCFMLITNGYYLALQFFSDTEISILILIDEIFWISMSIVPLAILAVGVDHVTKEAGKTCDVVKKLRTHSNNGPDAKMELEQFLLELLHRKLRFTACGLFSLDCTLIQSIIRTIITYIIILLQFQLDS